MKKLIYLFLFYPLLWQAVIAQDSIPVTFSQEQDTISKQRFVDRYENVFMTKVPTRHMFKLTLTFAPNYLFAVDNNAFQTIFYGLGYEYKIAPSFSIGTDVLINGGWGGKIGFNGMLDGNLYGRWYYDMKRRINQGVSVNNFTGNYVAIVAGKRWGKAEVDYQLSTIGVEFGLQRRFLNNGRIEFAIGASYQKYLDGHYPLQFAYGIHKAADFAISSRTSMGLAFGDWKRNKNLPVCEVLRCDEIVQQQWKLLWPKIYLSSRFIQGMIGLAYERKIGSGPLSLNGQVTTDYLRMVSNGTAPQSKNVSNDVQIWPSLQLRYYFTQKEAIRRGLGGQNLSGMYFGPHSDFVYYHSETIFGEGRAEKHLGVGAVAGFQQTLFKKAYIDLSLHGSYNTLNPQPNTKRMLAAIRTGFGITL
ncbi:hypothetical protein [Dyadobacter fanqingshengii]|uniref:DUF4421 domain-containing protein n=1 Tax=Dyadobacter fanqingshengii TaxID=2906443 RepID=A0A9X1T7H9_9BACT|nr:hypothetical protein [Dyadobacter fanqingshengii]MCF0038721.1 hypothetical protein [Dyadobacter fanqingshengii]USJ34447.1 hypothetical protein NFI81_17235 [Dyadobacter fanqingshengii]